MGVYAAAEGKEQDTEEFYRELQQSMHKISKNENINLVGDFSGRIGNQPIPECIGTYGEHMENKQRTTMEQHGEIFVHLINLK